MEAHKTKDIAEEKISTSAKNLIIALIFVISITASGLTTFYVTKADYTAKCEESEKKIIKLESRCTSLEIKTADLNTQLILSKIEDINKKIDKQGEVIDYIYRNIH